MVNPLLGQVNAIGFNFAPRGWSLCQGQLLPISQNTALFSLLGTTFGGDGRTTFGLPDLRGRSMVGVGNGPGLDNISWGERGGSYEVVITTTHMPSHTHTLYCHQTPGTQRAPGGNLIAGSTTDTPYSNGTADTPMKTGSVGNTGGTVPLNIRNPFLGLYMCIALQGIYPSRS